MILNLSLNSTNWTASTGEIMRRHPEGFALDPIHIVLAEWAGDSGKSDALTTIITGLVTLGQASGWQAQSLLICEVGYVPIFDEENEIVGARKVLELAINLVARGDHPVEEVRGKVKPDTWLSEMLPVEVRDAFIECWEALQ